MMTYVVSHHKTYYKIKWYHIICSHWFSHRVPYSLLRFLLWVTTKILSHFSLTLEPYLKSLHLNFIFSCTHIFSSLFTSLLLTPPFFLFFSSLLLSPHLSSLLPSSLLFSPLLWLLLPSFNPHRSPWFWWTFFLFSSHLSISPLLSVVLILMNSHPAPAWTCSDGTAKTEWR